MEIRDSVPPGFDRQGDAERLPACPSCGNGDRVHAVPAIYESARAAEETISSARRTIGDDDASGARKRAARQQLAKTPPPLIRSRLLAPAPKTHAITILGFALFFGLPGGFLWAMYRSSEDFANSTGWDADRSGDSTLALISILCFAISGCLLVALILALFRRRAIDKRRPAAEAVWRRGWYCTRCAVVCFRAGEQPNGVGAGKPISPEAFRRIVWETGGYAGRRRTGTTGVSRAGVRDV